MAIISASLPAAPFTALAAGPKGPEDFFCAGGRIFAVLRLPYELSIMGKIITYLLSTGCFPHKHVILCTQSIQQVLTAGKQARHAWRFTICTVWRRIHGNVGR